MRVLAAVDKFRGTATAHEAARAIADACWTTGHECVELPMADGGEGTLAALGGANRTLQVQGPLGAPVEAAWRFHRGTAVIEMALASGLQLIGGAEHNDVIAASTNGTGQLIDAALNLGADRIIVCLGGSATTDGGLGAVQAITVPARLKRVEFLVACDVTTNFLDAAEIFAAQKGATATQIKFLTTRLTGTAEHYRQRFNVDVTRIAGSGAAGGLAGGLFALGATLMPGFDIVADDREKSPLKETDLNDEAKAAHAKFKALIAAHQGPRDEYFVKQTERFGGETGENADGVKKGKATKKAAAATPKAETDPKVARFKERDADHDGKITYEEFQDSIPDKKAAKERFESRDTNHDGSLTLEEFVGNTAKAK